MRRRDGQYPAPFSAPFCPGFRRPACAAQLKNGLRGFTLLELLLALAVMAIGLGLGSSIFGEQARRSRHAVSLANAERVAQALGAYVAANKRLPCAADPAATDLGIAATGAACTSAPRGVVPWSTLGLQRRDVEDGHGRLFAYHVDPAFTATSITTMAQLCGTSASVGTGSAPDKALKAWVTVTGSLASPTFTQPLLSGQAIAFVLLGAGPNGHGAMLFDTATLAIKTLSAPPPTQLPEALNAVALPATASFGNYVDRDTASVGADGYDDLVFYRSLSTFVALYAGGLC
ncbi:MAG TPA: prepilin-type N-terminal cleavage/methylation domain-containing protein [Polaromonas sp.]|nr:prepilin-type N-terminal cleavage/methylation domain-containing protein [Polaromonas sp.]HQS31400.1 prepilin-type N-terminal cleavage/methylation domain-containing protein [Polaromonas sp.]HQS90699.1 prepilin-type N-terminal cleavage/methylation domain-containing protein [Polaromonas sp.]